MSQTFERKVYVNGEERTVTLKRRDVAASRLSREEKQAAREEARKRQSIETDAAE